MSQLGRISGPLLKANLLRQGVDLAFETDLLYLDVNNLRVGIKTTSPTHDLQVVGTTRTTNLEVTDRLDVGNFTIENNTITNRQGDITVQVPDGSAVVSSKFVIDSLDIFDNVIATNTSNANLEFRPNGTGRVEIYSDARVEGNLHVTGNITADGDIQLGDANTDSVSFNADIASDIVPDITEEYSLGIDGKRWNDVWAKTLIADAILTENVIVDGVNLGLRQGNIYYVAVNGNDSYSGTHQNDPYRTVNFALSQATAGDTVYIYPGEYQEQFPLTVPVGVTVKGTGIRSVAIVPTTATRYNDAFLLNGETTVEDLTVKDFFYDSINDTGHAFSFASNFTVTSRSPYIRNVSVLTKGSVTSSGDPLGFDQGDAGRGAKADGSLVNAASKEASMLFHSVTFITPGADALRCTNGVRIEWLNSFTYFANRGMYLYDSNDGFAGDGKTRIKITDTSGTWQVGDTITYYDVDGTSVLASGVVESIDGDFYIIDGKSSGWETLENRAGKTATVSGNASLSTVEKKFGTASLALDGNGDYITYASQPDFAYGTDDFTIEGWFYRLGDALTQIIYDQRTATPQIAPLIFINTSNQLIYNVNGNARITGTTVTANAWNHFAVSKSGTSTRLFLNGTQIGSTYTDANDYIQGPARIGARWDGVSGFNGYIDEIRVTKGLARYTSNFTAPTAAFTSDTSTVLLLHFNGANGSTVIVDDGITTQDIRTSSGGTASVIDLADYSDFGAELRSIGSACVYGNFGAVGDGPGVIAYLIGQNLAYIGNGKSSTNDPNTVIQANEVVELNSANLYYQSVDHKGDFRIGDQFYVNQQTGEVVFSNSDISVLGNITLTDGANTTFIDATKIETGNFRISGNTIETLSGGITVSAFNNQINLLNNVSIAGDLEVVGNVTVGGNITIGDQDTDSLDIIARVNSDIVPDATETYNLGSESKYWDTVFTTKVTTDSIVIDDNRIYTRNSNSNLELSAAGTGIIAIEQNDVIADQDLTVNGTTNLSNTVITGSLTHTGNLTVIGNTTQTGNITVNGDLTVSALVLESISIFQNNITTTNSNDDLQLEASGTGRIYVPENDVLIERNLTVNGVLTAAHIETEDTLIAPTISNGDIEIAGNLIRTTASNSDLELSVNGSGIIRLVDSDVLVEQDLTVTGTTTVNSTVTVTGVINQTGDFIQSGDFTQTGDFTLDGTLTVTEQAQFEDIRIDQNVITTTLGNNDLILQAAGTGNVIVPQNDVVIEQNLTVEGDVIAGSIVVDQSFSAPVLGTDDIIIENNVIRTTLSNSNLELRANGTGIVLVTDDNVRFEQDLTVNGVTTIDNLSITGPIIQTGNTTHVGNVNQTGNFTLTGLFNLDGVAQYSDIRVETNIIKTTIGNNDLILQAAGSGLITIPFNDVQAAKNMLVSETVTATRLVVNSEISSPTFRTSAIRINGNLIETTVSNSNLELRASGTGAIEIEQITVNQNVIGTVSGQDVVLAPTGTGIVNINSTQSVKLPVGSTAERPAGQTGMIRFNNTFNGYEGFDGVNWIRLDGVYDLDQNTYITAELTPGANDNTIRFYADGVQIAELNSARLDVGNIDVDSINIDGNTISSITTNSNIVFAPNGAGSTVIGNFAFRQNTITNIVPDSVTLFNQTGPNGYFKFAGPTGFVIPSGLDSQRGAFFETGMLRYNTTDNRVEVFNGTIWISVAGAGGGITITEAEDLSIRNALIFG